MSSEFDGLIENEALDSSPLGNPANDPGQLSDEENQAMEEMISSPLAEAAMIIADLPEGTALVLLKADEVPVVGTHYVIWDLPPRPYPVLVGSYAVSESDHLKESKNLGSSDIRQDRAAEYAKWRYKGYLAGQVSGL